MILKKQTTEKAILQLNSLNWLTGHWFGTSEFRQCELLWGAPFNNLIQGSYVIHQSGQAIELGYLRLSIDNCNVTLTMQMSPAENFPSKPVITESKFKLAKIKTQSVTFESEYEKPLNELEISRTNNSLIFAFVGSKNPLEAMGRFDLNLV